MSSSIPQGAENRREYPDFSDGTEFLLDLRHVLMRRQRRRFLVSSAAATVSAVFLFVMSFSMIQRQIDEELWAEYVLSETEEAVDLQELDEFYWGVYLEALLEEEDLDVLLEEILSLEQGEEWIRSINLKGRQDEA